MAKGRLRGFTLIELSIVLVIIGLIVGGVLVGQSLIAAATIRAQISQIEKYNTAANTFFDKYGGLPGDLNAISAAQFGFVSRAGTQGRGNGNGVIEPWNYVTNVSSLQWPFYGEPLLFWSDLSTARLLDQSFNTATDAGGPGGGGITYSQVGLYAPYPKGFPNGLLYVYGYNGRNYFSISGYSVQTGTVFTVDNNGHLYSSLGLTVAQAYAMDSKVDDGLPTSGSVQATYLNLGINSLTSATNAASPSSSTCYDTTSYQYSIAQNGGTGVNCALSFKMQAGD